MKITYKGIEYDSNNYNYLDVFKTSLIGLGFSEGPDVGLEEGRWCHSFFLSLPPSALFSPAERLAFVISVAINEASRCSRDGAVLLSLSVSELEEGWQNILGATKLLPQTHSVSINSVNRKGDNTHRVDYEDVGEYAVHHITIAKNHTLGE